MKMLRKAVAQTCWDNTECNIYTKAHVSAKNLSIKPFFLTCRVTLCNSNDLTLHIR